MGKKKPAGDDRPSFEQCLKQAEEVVARLEGGELSLDESLEQYERGVKSLKSCYELIQAAERRIELISGINAEGIPETRPLDDPGVEELTVKAAARSQKRSAPRTSSNAGQAVRGDDPSTLF